MFSLEVVSGMLAHVGGSVIGHIMNYERNGRYVMIEYRDRFGSVGWVAADMNQIAVA